MRMPVLQGRRRTVVLVAVAVVLAALAIPITLLPGLQTRLTDALGERFDSRVDLGSLRVSVLPSIRVAGDRLVLRHKGRLDVPPLIQIESFSAEMSVFGLIGRPLRFQRVQLTGLQINVPPGGLHVGDSADDDSDDSASAAGAEGNKHDGNKQDAAVPAPAIASRSGQRKKSPLVVDRVMSERAVLRILRREPGKQPRVFEISQLEMRDAGADTPWAFTATLTNPTPPGRIATHGTFGPWDAEQPSATPLDAEYEFADADLGVFDGIRGILHSTGAFKGVLERIEVEGEAEVPDFALSDVGQPVPLRTRFHSIVDGTNGNTWLRPVNGQFLQTAVVADGGVVEQEGEDGRTVTLDITMDDARLEDVLRLAVKSSEPPMNGDLKVRAKFVLPPGHRNAIEKMRLDGTFQIGTAHFAKGQVQAKLNALSQKARGDGDETPAEAEDVASAFTGRFAMNDGVIRFSNVSFSMPGTRVDVQGAYTVKSEALDFRGTVRLDAKLSQLTTGAKSVLLKLVEPLFRRGNVTVVPITIGGTVDSPKVGLDVRRALGGG
jgi:hypothetical protein